MPTWKQIARVPVGLVGLGAAPQWHSPTRSWYAKVGQKTYGFGDACCGSCAVGGPCKGCVTDAAAPSGFGPNPAPIGSQGRIGLLRADILQTAVRSRPSCPPGCVAVGTAGIPNGFGDAASDLNSFNGAIQAGDAALGHGDLASAISAYQAAGAIGVSPLGPDIDAQTNGASQAATQQAWQINGQLQALSPVTGQTDSANQAAAYAHQMQALYVAALAMPPAPAGPSPTPAPNPSPQVIPSAPSAPIAPSSSNQSDYTKPILWTGAGVGAAILIWAVTTKVV